MDPDKLAEGLIFYLCFLPLLTFHEFGHAWVAWKCGDDTARLQGRISLNPLAHIDLFGTVILPLLAVVLGAANSGLAGFIIGWGKPVPVNPYRLRNRRFDDTLVSLAGPGMNILVAAALLVAARLTAWGGIPLTGSLIHVAELSLFLCFFNLLPIPPLDGSHLLKNAIGMSEEQYLNLSRFGILILIVAIQFPAVSGLLIWATEQTLMVMAAPLGF